MGFQTSSPAIAPRRPPGQSSSSIERTNVADEPDVEAGPAVSTGVI